jgi:multidrug efflux system outer membrane protein
MTRGFNVLLAGSIALLSGCSLMPDYVRPSVAEPAAFKEDGPWRYARPEDQMPRGAWWKAFSDPTLDQLEDKLEGGSLQLAAAVARYDQAQAILAGQNALLFPELDATGGISTNRQSANRPLRGANQPNVYGNNFIAGGFNYEIDLWGRIRSSIASAQALAEASKADVESVKLSLHAQLAAYYFQLRGLDAKINLLSDFVVAYQRELEMIERRHDEGIVSGIDVARSKTLVEETQAQKTSTISQRALYEHAIATIIGADPSTFTLTAGTLPSVLPGIPPTVPSAVLQRRPDIAAAERRVAAANAQIGVARAAFFPTITLGGIGGFQSTDGAVLTAPNSFWSLGPLAFMPIFDAGRRDALVQQASAQTREATARYRDTVLTAFREVEDGLSRLRYLHEEREHRRAAEEAASHTYDLAVNRYREGAVSYLEVIDAETAKLRTETGALDVSTAQLQETVNLVRAIGGDWQ